MEPRGVIDRSESRMIERACWENVPALKLGTEPREQSISSPTAANSGSSSLLPKASRRLIGTQSGHFGMDADSNAVSELSPMPKPCSAHQEMTNNHCYDFRLPARTGQT
ncbi:hypothetical protein QQF64_003703 [Cirrhinus molitorella]|uniref:Uncharacterized protein n=1 Tax=Cirrhinus molitorella TaxID=172907 RepID=A0ABR3MM19_9TELE